MKILIGYDGSECANAALCDLQRAGLPRECDAVVMAVADVFLPPPINEDIDNTFPMYVPAGIRRAHEHGQKLLVEAHTLAEQAKSRIANVFPNWKVRAVACADSPAWALIRRADEWRPDLIVVGSHGHTAMGGRVILGSVSQRVLYEARTSVRVARFRPTADEPVKIVIGVDGSPDSYAVIAAVAQRSWPKKSEARIVVVLDTVMFVAPEFTQTEVVKWFEVGNKSDRDQLTSIFENASFPLRQTGLDISVVLTSGNPKIALVDEAEKWNADSLFVGAKGTSGIDRFLLGSVSAAAAARAHCSVEVVRKTSAETGPAS
jgi:nucleotide-binding universal stress UspA family protein